MKYFLYTLISLIYCSCLHGQYQYIQSDNNPDTLIALKLIEEANNLTRDYKLDSALIKANEAYSIIVKATNDSSLLAAKGLKMIGRVYYYQRDYDKAQEAYESSLSILENNLGKNHEDVGSSYANLGTLYYQRREYETALKLYNKALTIAKNLGLDKGVASAYSKMAFIYWQKGEYKDALAYFKNTYELEKKVHGEFSQNVAFTLNNLGGVCTNFGQFYKALSYFERSLKIRSDSLGKNHPNVYKSYANIGTTYSRLEQFDKTELYLLKAMNGLIPILGKNSQEVSQIHLNLGLVYDELEKHTLSLYHHKKRLNHEVSIFGEKDMSVAESHYWVAKAYYKLDSIGKAKFHIAKSNSTPLIQGVRTEDEITGLCYQLLSRIHNDNKETQEALSYGEKAYDRVKNFLGESHPLSIEIQLYRGDLNNSLGNYQTAEEHFTSVLNKLEYRGAGYLVNEDKIILLLKALKTIGSSYLKEYDENDQFSTLESAHNYLNLAVEVLEYQSHFLDIQDRSKLLKKTNGIYTDAIRTNYLLYGISGEQEYAREAFRLSELGESFLLYSKMLESKLLKNSNFPDSLKTKSEGYENMISEINQEIYMLQSNGIEHLDSSILQLQAQVFDINQEYRNWKEELISNYGKYYSIADAFDVVSVQDVQKNIDSDSNTFLKYFVGKDYLTTFVINKGRYDIFQSALSTELYESIENFRESCSKDNFDSNIEDHFSSSTMLYNQLIRPIDTLLGSKLVIAPSGYLGYLPFEALLTKKPIKFNRWNDYHYLIQDKQISYCYSATMMYDKEQERPSNTEMAFVGFAPYSNANSTTSFNVTRSFIDSKELTLQGLPHSGEEISTIQKNLGGTGYIGQDATMQEFISSLEKNNGIVHIASHAKSNFERGEFSFIAFPNVTTDDVIDAVFADDIADLDIAVRLIVLSACETGVGELQKGEGIISLARAFFESGARSVLTSFWEVADESTKKIMVEFYLQLSKGVDKQTALHHAKLNYIKSVDKKNKSLAHPFYWSPFVLIGDTEALFKE